MLTSITSAGHTEAIHVVVLAWVDAGQRFIGRKGQRADFNDHHIVSAQILQPNRYVPGIRLSVMAPGES